jgi:hypothetical protein
VNDLLDRYVRAALIAAGAYLLGRAMLTPGRRLTAEDQIRLMFGPQKD